VLTCVPPAVYFVSPSLRAGGGRWVDFGVAEDLQPDNFSMLTYEFMVKDGWLVLPQRGFVWAMSSGNEGIKVFSSTCTHLACNVIWNDARRVFECPCHSGRFDERGHPIAGPPTRPLSILEHKVQEGNLMVYMSL
jgi:Rieske Fe-S protein